jgi:hypothetical protein
LRNAHIDTVLSLDGEWVHYWRILTFLFNRKWNISLEIRIEFDEQKEKVSRKYKTRDMH